MMFNNSENDILSTDNNFSSSPSSNVFTNFAPEKNHQPAELANSWQDLHLNQLTKNLMSSITSTPLDHCFDYVELDENYLNDPDYIHPCFNLPFYQAAMGDGNYTSGTHFLGMSTESAENSQPTEFPDELTHINMTNLIAYSILFPFAAVGNLLVLVALFRSRHRKSRVNLMILHLSLADMIVTFIFLPMEIAWQVTIQWEFGNLGCKVYKFFSAFGFYMSSMVLVCISLDRYFAVLHPLKVNDAQRRGKIMLFFAWLISAFISLPQVSDYIYFFPIRG